VTYTYLNRSANGVLTMRQIIIAAICMAGFAIAWAEPPKVIKTATPIKLEYGKSLMSFSPKINLSRQVEKVSVIGFEPEIVEYRSGDTYRPAKKMSGVRKQPNVYMRRK